MRSRFLALFMATLVAFVGFTAPGSPASADSVHHITAGPADATPNAACAIQYGAYPGEAICGTTVLEFQLADGRWLVFVVGTDRAVWHIWQRWAGDPTWSGWHTLGGRANDGVGLWRTGSFPNGPEIYVLGTDNNLWCNERLASWTGWHRC